MAAGTGMPPQLIAYWSKAGPGGAKIQWGRGGDFDRCRVAIQKAITDDGDKPLSDRMISGLCATLHKMNTGAVPGKAPGE